MKFVDKLRKASNQLENLEIDAAEDVLPVDVPARLDMLQNDAKGDKHIIALIEIARNELSDTLYKSDELRIKTNLLRISRNIDDMRERKSKKQYSKAAHKKAASARAEHEVWRRAGSEIQNESPRTLTKTELAKKIKQKLNLSQSIGWIRTVI
ncbi:MAG: hypothetical protein QGG67_12535 [Gammaproteobacteria bacterium]|jgi:hypothetical protein|nr:hypothetical protein [Gammaproteobacteria bacterium]|tara:strand:- start:70 stop:528 length:459 start_codon:yes stop_codon:yes gene_type:complete